MTVPFAWAAFSSGQHTLLLQLSEILTITPRNHQLPSELPGTLDQDPLPCKLQCSRSQTCALESPTGLVKTQPPAPTPLEFGLLRSWVGPRVAILGKFPGDAEDAGLGATL